jgi:hypothetical protein
MIDGLLQDLATKAKARTGASEELVMWFLVVTILLVFAVVFLSVAAYVWLSAYYGGAVAGVAVGGFHALLASAAFIRCIVLRRRTQALALAKLEAAAKQPAWWAEPGVLAVSLEVAKIIGWRKFAPFVTAGILAASLTGKRGDRSPRPRANGAH